MLDVVARPGAELIWQDTMGRAIGNGGELLLGYVGRSPQRHVQPLFRAINRHWRWRWSC